MTLIDYFQLMHDSALGTYIRESQYAYPLIEATHLLGLAVSVGLIFLTDLRLIGLTLRNVPVADVLRQLRPWLLTGFVATFISGTLLFWADAVKIWHNPVFPWKMLFILLAGLNALWFELRLGRRVHAWGSCRNCRRTPDSPAPPHCCSGAWLPYAAASSLTFPAIPDRLKKQQ